MGQIETILTATDLSAPARHAAARAVRLARETGAQLRLLHVMNQGAIDDLRALLGARTGAVERQLVDAAREDLARLAAGIGEQHGIAPGVHLAAGTVLAEILDHADAVDADLLVLVARGESFMRHLLLGSTAERLLRKTRRPILVVKQTPIDRYRRVLVPVDFSRWSREGVALARAVAPGAELVLMHAFEVPFEGKLRLAGVDEQAVIGCRLAAQEDALKRLRQLGAEAGLDPNRIPYVILQGDASRRIVEQEQEQDCDLVVLGKHGRNILEETLLGSVTKHVLAESNCDVVVSAKPSAA